MNVVRVMWLVVVMVVATVDAAATRRYVVEKDPNDEYWVTRARMIREEENMILGGDLNFEKKERLANQVLMSAKRKEIDDGFKDPSKFLPSQNFLVAGSKIRKSPVFQIIEDMPKGAVLHAHDTAIVSSEYVFWNITFRPNLYVCDVDEQLKLHFAAKPSNEDGCDWKLLEEVRKNDTQRIVDHRIAKQLSMMTRNPEQLYPDNYVAWKKFISIFIFITPMLTYRPVYEDHFYQGLLEFYNDNILYLELRTTLPSLYELDGTVHDSIETARVYKKVTERFIAEHPDFIGVRLIYAPPRHINDTKFDEYVTIARQLKAEMPDFIAGFDLVGQEDLGEPLVEFADKLRMLGQDVQLFFHAGETNWYGTATDDNLIDAVLLNTKRIGHGYALLKHPKIMEIVREKKIAIEISPISNQVLNLVKDLRNHPASALFSQDYPVVISNDDPGLWGAQGLSYDFYEAFVGMMSRSADLRSLKKLAMNSIEYSSMTQDEKNRAMDIWRHQWEEFVNELTTDM